jgi:hypothetical protein
MRHLADAEGEARAIYDRSHSNDPSGPEEENVPEWALQFFRLFEAQESNRSASAMADKVRRERSTVARSIVGAQAPLGHRQADGIAQRRNETSLQLMSGLLVIANEVREILMMFNECMKMK